MISMAKMLWAFEIQPDPAAPPDADPKTLYSASFVGAPHEFAAVLKVRSPRHREAVEEDFQRAREVLRRYED
jgi:hypothetical protein